MKDLTGRGHQLGRERALAGGHWLLGAAPSLQEARADWEESGSAWLQRVWVVLGPQGGPDE